MIVFFSLWNFWYILQNILAFLFNIVKYDQIIAYCLFTIFNIFGAMQQLLGKTLNVIICVLIASFFLFFLSVPSVMKLWQRFQFVISKHTLLHWRKTVLTLYIHLQMEWQGKQEAHSLPGWTVGYDLSSMPRYSLGSMRSVQLPSDHLVEMKERAVCHQ